MKAMFSGSCLNGGHSRVQVTPCHGFALFLHKKVSAPVKIKFDVNNLWARNHLVNIGHPPRLKVIEHLFSALYGLNLFEVRIDIFGNEIPFFDGSSRSFVKLLKNFKNNNAVKTIDAEKSFTMRSKDAFIRYEPEKEKKFVIEMELAHPFFKKQKLRITLNRDTYVKEIAPARTFAFTDENDPRLRNLPPYGFGITRKGIYSVEPLRYRDEAVRHKILDLLGDLYVLRGKVVGKITAKNTSHRLNIAFAKKLLSNA